MKEAEHPRWLFELFKIALLNYLLNWERQRFECQSITALNTPEGVQCEKMCAHVQVHGCACMCVDSSLFK